MTNASLPLPSPRTVKVEVFRTDTALAADPQLVGLRSRLSRERGVVATQVTYTRPANAFGKWVGIEVAYAA
jgi:hypothetical protein